MKSGKLKPAVIKKQIILLLFGTIMYCSTSIAIEKVIQSDFKVGQNIHIEEK